MRIASSSSRQGIATSTGPKISSRAEAVRPGAKAVLEAKASQLVGGPKSSPLVPGRGPVQGVFLADRADVMLGYCSSGLPVMREIPDLVNVALPPDLTVGPAYGLIVLSDDPVAARFALFVLSEQGQAILRKYGFDPIGLARVNARGLDTCDLPVAMLKL